MPPTVQRTQESTSSKTRFTEILQHLKADTHHGARNLAKNLGFSVPAVITITLGIFICTVVFSVFNAVILKALPYPEPVKILAVFGTSSRVAGSQLQLSSAEVARVSSVDTVFD